MLELAYRECMTLGQKARLLLRLTRLPGGLAVMLLLLVVGRWVADMGLIDASPSGRKMTTLLIDLLPLCIFAALVFSYLKLHRGIHALLRGEKLRATVKQVRVHRHRDEDEPLYVIDWIDTHGYSGSSLPAELHEFYGYNEGVEITIYRNNKNDSWWERDLIDS